MFPSTYTPAQMFLPPIENITCTLSSDMMSLDISWTAPVTGAHGGDLDPKGITYQIYRYNSSGAASGWQLIDETAALTYTFNFPRQRTAGLRAAWSAALQQYR